MELPDDETVERVAKAIFNAAGGYKIGWDRAPEVSKKAYRHQARAAIDAYEDDFYRIEV